MCVVADYLEGRSQEQCLTRWSRLKDIEHSKYHTWSTEEDMVCSLAVDLFVSVIHRMTTCLLFCPGLFSFLVPAFLCLYSVISLLLPTWEHL